MKPFRFRLQPVLQLRMSERDARRGELAQALQAVEVLDQQAAELRQQIQATRAHMVAACQPGVVNVDRLLNSQRYERLLSVQLGDLHRRRAQIEAEVQRRRQRLVEADQQVRVLEQLRARQEFEYQRLVLRDDQKQFDDIAVRRFREQNTTA